MTEPSPLAPARFPDMPVISGVRLNTFAAGIRYKGRTDLLLAELVPGTTIAGTFTRSLTASAPVEWCRRAVKRGRVRGILVNAGNANAFTGIAGIAAVKRTVSEVAKRLGCKPEEVFTASTGVIGQPLPADRVVSALDDLHRGLGEGGFDRAARAIVTTDTFPKGATRTATIGGVAVTINGIAKGSGMIAPDMATMLGFVFTDAAIPSKALQAMLTRATDRSFNCITVDGDTSTSDTLLLCATGAAGNPKVAEARDPRLKDFRRALEEVMIDLAQQVVRDGEGAAKFATIAITGAASNKAARKIGLAIGNSPLVKTALAAGDANWGRLVMAVGKAGQKADRDKLTIHIGGVPIAAQGGLVEGYDETPVARHMKGQEVLIEIDVGIGRGKAVVWTCDLTHRYIDINANYRS